MFHTIRHWFAFTLLVFVTITILSILLLYYYINKKESSFSNFKDSIETTNTLIFKDVTVLRDFFENETINSEFFRTKKSKLLNAHEKLNQEILTEINTIDSLQNYKEFNLGIEQKKLKGHYTHYASLVDQIVKAILYRGFKDEGLEGKMRYCAHNLEVYQKELGLVNILQLRRHEKDFIIRQENEYVYKHDLLVKELFKQLSENKEITFEGRTEAINLLKEYHTLFKQLVEYDKKIGIKNSIGLKAEIDSQVGVLASVLQSLVSKAQVLEERAQTTLRIVFFTFLSIFVVLSVVVTNFIARKFTFSIVELKEKISEFVAGDFSKRNILPVKNARYEIDSLANNFSLMEQHILNQMNMLRNTNAELAVLIGKASKDIKKPLTEIKGIYDNQNILLSEPNNKLVNKSWDKVLTIIEELGLVKDIKTDEIHIEKIELLNLIKTVFHEHKSLPQFEQIVFSLSYSLKHDFYSSKELIKHIFYQLFENSIKYSKKRQGLSSLNVKVDSLDKYTIKVVISDNGIGIKKEDQEHIFQMFYRTANKIEGTGLGLYIVQNSLQKINGTILLESDENKGTVFTLIIPNKFDYFKNIRTEAEAMNQNSKPKALVFDFHT
jgi:signal transduction histidine kinase